MKKNNVLICNYNPRDIDEFYESLKLLPYDKFLVRYQKHPYSDMKIMEFFLSSSKYDTMVIFSDDLIVDPVGLELLLQDHREHPEDVITGICNFDMFNNKDRYCFRLIGDTGEYPKIRDTTPYFVKYKAEKLMKYPYLFRVEFNAMACMVLSKDILKQVRFRGEFGIDQNFCDDARAKGIDVLVDTRAKFNHLAGRKDGHLENFMVDKKEPSELFINSSGT